MNVNVGFCRTLLQLVQVDVRKHKPTVKLKDAWVWKAGKDHWEFHYGGFYWHGSADNAFEARAKGWSAWLQSEGYDAHA